MSVETVDIIDDFKWFVDSIFDEAIMKEGSDIHIEPWKNVLYIRYRIDWDIRLFYEIETKGSPENQSNLLTRIKIMAQLKIDESRIPQDWQISYKYKDAKTNKKEEVDMRVSTFPVLNGEKIVIRLLRKDVKLLNINSLGFLQLNLKLINKALKYKEGLVLVSGPTGSWKTTTLYAMLNSFNPMEHNISTLEDPVEYKMEWINQSQVRSEIWYDFSNGLRTLLRQDPDIILVWEIRDRETAKLAIEAALTWHLVFGTIHANRWSWVIERLVNMWIDAYLIASSLRMILSQRLVKKLCSCGKEIELDNDQIAIFRDWLGHIRDSVGGNLHYREKVGCDNCLWMGYDKRLWLHETILFDKDIRKLINVNIDEKQWQDTIRNKNFLTLYQDGLLKAANGLTDLEQILPYKDV